MEKIVLNPEEITFDNVKKYLNDLFYEIRNVWNTAEVNDEGKDLLADCLDGAPEGILGVQLLMGHLTGSTFSLVTDPNTGKRDYVKDEPVDPKTIYEQASQLIDFINDVLEKYKRNKSL